MFFYEKARARIDAVQARYPTLPRRKLLLTRLLREVSRSFSEQADELLQRWSIHPGQFHALLLLAGAQGKTINMSELGESSSETAATTSRLINGIVDLNLAERVYDETDRRKIFIEITPRGLDTVNEIMDPYTRLASRQLNVLDEGEQIALEAILKKLLTGQGGARVR